MGLLDFVRKMKVRGSEVRLLLLGLDNAGKTAVLKRIANESDITNVTPTPGYSIKTVIHGSFKLNVWDLGGQKAIRGFWRNYYDDTDAIIYVIDSSDRRRIEETGVELQQILEEVKLAGVPILIYLNKTDLMFSLNAGEVTRGLNLHAIRDRQWQVVACSAKTGEGIQEGLEFIISEVSEKFRGHDAPAATTTTSTAAPTAIR